MTHRVIQWSTGHVGACALHGGFGDFHADRTRPGLGQRHREIAGAEAQIQHALAAADLAEHEPPAEVKVRWLQVVGQPAPQLLVVVLHPRDGTARVLIADASDRPASPRAPCPHPRDIAVRPRLEWRPRGPMNRRLLAITPVDHPGGAETTLLRLLDGLHRRDWTIALTTPGQGPLRDDALRSGYAWHALPLGGLRRRTGARAIASWTTARRLASRADVVYLNGGVCGRLIPALAPLRRRGRPRLVLHIHDMVRRVLVPRGRLLLSTPSHGRLRVALGGIERFSEPLGDHLHLYTRRSLARTLDELGFDAIEVRSAGGPPGLKRMLLARATR